MRTGREEEHSPEDLRLLFKRLPRKLEEGAFDLSFQCDITLDPNEKKSVCVKGEENREIGRRTSKMVMAK